MWGIKNPVHGWWECNPVQPLWKTVCRFLKKLKIELPCSPVILKIAKTLLQRDTCTLMFTATLFTIAKLQKQSKGPSIDEWIKK